MRIVESLQNMGVEPKHVMNVMSLVMSVLVFTFAWSSLLSCNNGVNAIIKKSNTILVPAKLHEAK